MKYTSRADLLIAAGESIKMQENAGIEPKMKIEGTVFEIKSVAFVWLPYNKDNEFPLAVVEGKPVFVGDELYSPLGMRFIVDENGMPCCPNTCSWNPPKPATVMVELLREDAEYYSRSAMIDQREERFQSACRKALEKA